MYSKVISAAVFGINAFVVEIETHLDNALPSFSIVGLPDSAVKESRERVAAAIKNSNYVFPAKKITVNLAPADLRKNGSSLDLPIAIALLEAYGFLPKDCCSDSLLAAELSLEQALSHKVDANAQATKSVDRVNNIENLLVRIYGNKGAKHSKKMHRLDEILPNYCLVGKILDKRQF